MSLPNDQIWNDHLLKGSQSYSEWSLNSHDSQVRPRHRKVNWWWLTIFCNEFWWKPSVCAHSSLDLDSWISHMERQPLNAVYCQEAFTISRPDSKHARSQHPWEIFLFSLYNTIFLYMYKTINACFSQWQFPEIHP